MDSATRKAHDEIIDEAWQQMMDACPPSRHPPKPTNQTRVLRVIAVAEQLGLALMPHQICIAASLTEAADDAKPLGALKRKEALIMMARQSGKSAVLQVLACERVLATPYQRWLWGAQRLESAILQIEQETWPTIQERGLDTKYGIEDADGNLDGQDLGLHEVYVNLGKEATTVKEGRGRLSKNARIAGGVAAAVGVALLVPSLFYLIDNKEEPSEVDVMVTPQEVRMMVSLPLPIGWGR